MFKVANFMTRSPVTVDPQTNLHVALTMLRHHRIRHLCVVEDARLVGILSETDILLAAQPVSVGELTFNAELSEQSVAGHMTQSPRLAHPNMHISEAAEFMCDIGAHSLPVLLDGHLIGIVTASDCIRALVLYASRHEEQPNETALPAARLSMR